MALTVPNFEGFVPQYLTAIPNICGGGGMVKVVMVGGNCELFGIPEKITIYDLFEI